ncbi:MAG: acyl carrier protein [Desulfobacteraceae bacterium]|nr:acyl carrier protein [Desulfobacteraceae bacterium]
MSEHKKRIRKFLLENFLFDDNEGALKDDASFLDQGIIDSTGILELINWLEETFSIQVFEVELIPENLDSVNKLLVFIKKKRGLGVADACL